MRAFIVPLALLLALPAHARVPEPTVGATAEQLFLSHRLVQMQMPREAVRKTVAYPSVWAQNFPFSECSSSVEPNPNLLGSKRIVMTCPQFQRAKAQLSFKFETEPKDDIIYLTEILVDRETMRDPLDKEAFQLNPFTKYGSFQSIMDADDMVQIDLNRKARDLVPVNTFFERLREDDYECHVTAVISRAWKAVCEVQAEGMGEYSDAQVAAYVRKHPPITFNFSIYNESDLHLISIVSAGREYKEVNIYGFFANLSKRSKTRFNAR